MTNPVAESGPLNTRSFPKKQPGRPRTEVNDTRFRLVNLLVTTAGVLPPEPVADFVESLTRTGGEVTVLNVVQTPPDFLRELADPDWQPFGSADHTANDRETRRYVRERGEKMVAPVVAALTRRNIIPETVFVEADDVADAIVSTSESLGAQAIVMGATRRLFTESAWKSISMRVATTSKIPVLLIPSPPDRALPTHNQDDP